MNPTKTETANTRHHQMDGWDLTATILMATGTILTGFALSVWIIMP